MYVLYVCVLFYALGTGLVLASLYNRSDRLQKFAVGAMILGFAAHTIWTGLICVRTGHPPLTNLPEAAGFIAWTIFAVELLLLIRFRVHAAAFFVYPLVLMLMLISALVGEHFQPLAPSQRSSLFTAHLLLTTVGVAALLIGLAFLMLFQVQQRALKKKNNRGALYEWIPSLEVCDMVSYRSIALGFAIYTTGLLFGILWAYKINVGYATLGTKEIGAIIAWIIFAVILQSYFSGGYRSMRSVFYSAAAFISIVVSIFGIHHA
jgi:ABC-type uncharacterized transport system, permease component